MKPARNFFFLRMLSTSTLAEMAEVAVAVSVVVSEGTTLICNGRVVRVASESTLGDILVATGLGGRRGHMLDVRSAVSATANRQDAKLSDEIGLHAEFGRRFLFFRLRPMSDVSSEPEARGSSEGSTVNALEVLLASASTKTLPDPPRSEKDKTTTAMDRLIENVIEHHSFPLLHTSFRHFGKINE